MTLHEQIENLRSRIKHDASSINEDDLEHIRDLLGTVQYAMEQAAHFRYPKELFIEVVEPEPAKHSDVLGYSFPQSEPYHTVTISIDIIEGLDDLLNWMYNIDGQT